MQINRYPEPETNRKFAPENIDDFMLNVGKYTIHGCYAYSHPVTFSDNDEEMFNHPNETHSI